ncbi:MAG: hypothetical protein DRK00_07885, partial [Thermoprotei archaeon]
YRLGVLRGIPSYFDRGVVDGILAQNHSAAVFACLSLAPVVKVLVEGRAFLAAVDAVEVHLTPLLQAAMAVNLARLAKMGWECAEEYPASLLMITHSSIVLAALLREVRRGVEDPLIFVEEGYRVGDGDVKSVVFYREDSAVKVKGIEGIVEAGYLREYMRLI